MMGRHSLRRRTVAVAEETVSRFQLAARKAAPSVPRRTKALPAAAPAVSGVKDAAEEARRQTEEEERRRQAEERARLRMEERNRSVLNSDCTCISINERSGEYSCSDGFASGPDSKKPLCDILRR